MLEITKHIEIYISATSEKTAKGLFPAGRHDDRRVIPARPDRERLLGAARQVVLQNAMASQRDGASFLRGGSR
jgi:hypothetical protein